MERLSLKGKVAIITGATSGIGAGVAELFAARGASLAITGRNAENLAKTKTACVKRGISEDAILALQGDVTDSKFLERLVNETISKFGQLDILVNNAGIIVQHSLETGNLSETYDTIMNVNVRSVIELTQMCIPHLKKTKGNIVNISSVAGVIASHTNGFYNVSKAALDQFTKCLSYELGPDGVRVNAVNPGAIMTPIFQLHRFEPSQQEQLLTKLASGHALNRIGEVQEVAEYVAFIASDAASFVTGDTALVDGGRHVMIKSLFRD